MSSVSVLDLRCATSPEWSIKGQSALTRRSAAPTQRAWQFIRFAFKSAAIPGDKDFHRNNDFLHFQCFLLLGRQFRGHIRVLRQKLVL